MVNENRSSFTGKIGFVLAAAGSAVGLGNIWRFPYLAAKFGGGIFLLTYLVLAVTLGFALMTAEIAIGRKTGLSVIGAYKKLDKRFSFLGYLAALVPAIILPYYSVIGGWVTKYFVAFVSGNGLSAASDSYFGGFITSTAEPIGWFLIYLGLTALVVLFGVEKGIEKVSKIMMPVLVVLSVVIAAYGLTIPGAIEGVKYYFTPDFSKFSASTVLAAMGQLFYSMSLAMGIMITYGSYVKDDVDLNKSIRNIEIFDTMAAFLAGLMIIPAVYVFMGKEGMSEGPSLMFVSLPKIFEEMGLIGNFVGVVFFIMVLFAALTSCVSIMETLVANCMEKFNKSRKTVSLAMAGIYAGLATVICLGYNVLYFEIKLPNGAVGQLLDIMDYASNYVLMPVVSILTCILIGWIAKPKYIIEEVKKSSTSFKRAGLYTVMVKFVAPVMLLVLFLKSLGLF